METIKQSDGKFSFSIYNCVALQPRLMPADVSVSEHAENCMETPRPLSPRSSFVFRLISSTQTVPIAIPARPGLRGGSKISIIILLLSSHKSENSHVFTRQFEYSRFVLLFVSLQLRHIIRPLFSLLVHEEMRNRRESLSSHFYFDIYFFSSFSCLVLSPCATLLRSLPSFNSFPMETQTSVNIYCPDIDTRDKVGSGWRAFHLIFDRIRSYL